MWLEIARRFGPQVHDHVEDGSPGTTNELALPLRRGLPVHAAQGVPALVPRDAALGQGRRQAGRGELLRAPGPGEEAPVVRVPVGADDYHPRKARRLEDHGSTVAVGMGTMNWPPHSRMWESWATISSLTFQGG